MHNKDTEGVSGRALITLAKLFGIFDSNKNAQARKEDLIALDLLKKMINSKAKDLKAKITTLETKDTKLKEELNKQVAAYEGFKQFEKDLDNANNNPNNDVNDNLDNNNNDNPDNNADNGVDNNFNDNYNDFY